MLVLHHLCAL
ncbi:Retrovirus-related Pol polyprotein LINE-1 [Zea mays]|uniref:Retrovirus-related Pol polyprotein LINE-1 n=1 Tax=Zea mays TaxID=4577 RepID=A0A1D6ITP7_MAIZE|nr:Retrovirus-related Pol polyprotein LINE-1 [Zea mays]